MATGQGQPQGRASAAQDGRIKDFFIPADAQDWNTLFKSRADLKSMNIHNLPAEWVASASEATNVQYLMLRSYSPTISRINTFRKNCHQFGFTTEVLERAADLLAASTEWQRYLYLLHTGDSIDDIPVTSNRWPGSFSTVARLQQQTMTVEGIHDRARTQLTAGETRTGRRRVLPLPDAEDEASPNAAALILLQTVSHLAHSQLEWILNRVHFICQFGTMRFTAFTDGALRSKQTRGVFALVEAKKRLRTVHHEAILMQEACEVVGWVMNNSREMARFKEHLLLISQDRHELFITFASIEEAYERHLRNATDTDSFLVMKTYGPYDTGSCEEMNEFGQIILGSILIVNPVA
ncbi:hypothetical protein N7530_008302 [Penicillium desertorum]|uniref:Uncharacterized protein n=1 Tax=Penicillium desertorum TaxID=1303715 RepID=A0A9X0BKS3_9EURO|nr:hypothetical protein N7530_008302 [Penicillium desertorum]